MKFFCVLKIIDSDDVIISNWTMYQSQVSSTLVMVIKD
jgi:hypothetical protein